VFHVIDMCARTAVAQRTIRMRLQKQRVVFTALQTEPTKLCVRRHTQSSHAAHVHQKGCVFVCV
jgi:hypothetical protein